MLSLSLCASLRDEVVLRLGYVVVANNLQARISIALANKSDFTAKPTAPVVAPRCATASECVGLTNDSAEVPATVVSPDVKRRNKTLSLLFSLERETLTRVVGQCSAGSFLQDD